MAKDDEIALKKAIEAALSRAKNTPAARRAIAALFPKAKSALREYGFPETQDRAERYQARRISISDFATAYFSLQPQPATWGKVELEEIFDQADPAISFAKMKEKVSNAAEMDRPRLRRLFLDALANAFTEKRRFTSAWLVAIADASPEFIQIRDDDFSLFATDNKTRLLRVIYRGLDTLPIPRRKEVVKPVISYAYDITLLCSFLRSVAGDLRENGAKRRSEFLGDEIEHLREMLLMRVQDLAAKGNIWSQADPDELIWFWWGCDLDNEVIAFLKEQMQDPTTLKNLLNVTVSLVRSTRGNFERVRTRDWGKLIDLDELRRRASDLLINAENDQDRYIAERFIRAWERISGSSSPRPG